MGVSRELLIETMGEKEEETAKRLRETKEKQVSRDESASPSPWEKTLHLYIESVKNSR